MNGGQARGFLAAAAACDPSGDYAPAAKLVAAVAEAAPSAEWEAAVCGDAASVLRLALRGAGAEGARGALARAFSIAETALFDEPAASRPWIDAVWSAASGRWTAVEIATRGSGNERLRALAPKPGPEQVLATRRFSPRAFAEPIAAALKEFDALEPLAAMQFAAGRAGWSLIPARPIPWPLFLRSDLSAAFRPRAAQLSLLLRDARVVALDFDGESLWARFE
jgi:hypothetical protein